jgi:hypothetical protein
MNIHLDKKLITVLVVCTLLGGIIGGVVGSLLSGRGNLGYRGGRSMMEAYGNYDQRDSSYGRGGMMGGQGRYNQNYQQNQVQPVQASGTPQAN